MARYLVTGGCGFIGSHVVGLLLNQGHQVVVLDDISSGRRSNLNPQAELIVGSILDRPILQQAFEGVDGCFHLAALVSVTESAKDWLKSYAINNTGSMQVFDVARSAAAPVPVVFASSAAVFGDNQQLPLSEDSTTRPLSIYGADKFSDELYGSIVSGLHGVSITALRLFNVFGPRQDSSSPYSGVISQFVNKIRVGQSITIFGDGEQTRDFIFVADVAAAFLAAMTSAQKQRAAFQIFNVCTGVATSICVLAATVEKIFNCQVEKTFRESRVGDIRFSLGSPRKMVAELKVVPKFDLEAGLRLMGDARHGD